jgi:hypothetical protein
MDDRCWLNRRRKSDMHIIFLLCFLRMWIAHAISNETDAAKCFRLYYCTDWGCMMYEDSIYHVVLCISCALYLAPGDDHSSEHQILMWSHQLLVWTNERMHMFYWFWLLLATYILLVIMFGRFWSYGHVRHLPVLAIFLWHYNLRKLSLTEGGELKLVSAPMQSRYFFSNRLNGMVYEKMNFLCHCKSFLDWRGQTTLQSLNIV